MREREIHEQVNTITFHTRRNTAQKCVLLCLPGPHPDANELRHPCHPPQPTEGKKKMVSDQEDNVEQTHQDWYIH